MRFQPTPPVYINVRLSYKQAKIMSETDLFKNSSITFQVCHLPLEIIYIENHFLLFPDKRIKNAVSDKFNCIHYLNYFVSAVCIKVLDFNKPSLQHKLMGTLK